MKILDYQWERLSKLEDSGKAYLLWAAGFLTVLLIHLFWAAANQTPAVWDMAHHQIMGWLHLASFRDGNLLSELSRISSYYPPLYYLEEVFVLSLTGATKFLPWIVNIPGLFLLSFFTYRIALLNSRPASAAAAGVVVLLLPLVAWTSRETLLDPSLAGWVTLGFFLVVKSEYLHLRGWTLLLGIVLTLGMLTKWTFCLFLIAPIVYSLVRTTDRSRAIRNLLDAVLISLPATFWWYLPNLNTLLDRFRLTSAAAEWEQDPSLVSLWGWIYYPRSLSGYYLFILLSCLFVWVLVRILRKGTSGVNKFLLWTVFGGILLLTLLKAKDPRYLMPLAAPVVIILMSEVDKLKARFWTVGVVAFAFLQFLAVSFSFPLTSGKLALFERENDKDYLGMSREWVLYSSNYFGVVGPPRVEDWRHADISVHMKNGERIGFVPDAARFNPSTFRLVALEREIWVEVTPIGTNSFNPERLEGFDWIVGKTGDQGISYITQFNEQIYDAVEAHNWKLVEKWSLPDGTEAVLWQNPTRSQ